MTASKPSKKVEKMVVAWIKDGGRKLRECEDIDDVYEYSNFHAYDSDLTPNYHGLIRESDLD